MKLVIEITEWIAIISQMFAVYYYGSPEHLHIGWVAIFSIILLLSLMKTNWFKE